MRKASASTESKAVQEMGGSSRDHDRANRAEESALLAICAYPAVRDGIYNPYTRGGAIPGLLRHGPHNVRDWLAAYILKQTGSCGKASYAIQDTPDMVAKHYGRFLPQDKAALAARILNQMWEAA